MKTIRVVAILATVLPLIVSCAGTATPTAAGEVVVEKGIPYHEVDGQVQALDIAYPAEGIGTYPVVFYFHPSGGGTAGIAVYSKDLAKRGYVVVSPARITGPISPSWPGRSNGWRRTPASTEPTWSVWESLAARKERIWPC